MPTKMALAVRTDMALATCVSDAVKGSPLAKEEVFPRWMQATHRLQTLG